MGEKKKCLAHLPVYDVLSMKPEIPFSSELLRLYNQFQTAPSKEARIDVLVQFATQFSAEHDITDPCANENFHSIVEDFDNARAAYIQAALRLGRFGVEFVQQVLDEEGDDAVEDFKEGLN